MTISRSVVVTYKEEGCAGQELSGNALVSARSLPGLRFAAAKRASAAFYMPVSCSTRGKKEDSQASGAGSRAVRN